MRQVLQPGIYLISILPTLSILTLEPSARAGRTSLALAFGTFGVVLLQHAVNVIDDITDWGKRADVAKADSWVRFHGGRLSATRLHAVASTVLGAVVGAVAIVMSGRWVVLWLAVPLVALGFLYNLGRRPLSYTALGEWVTAICYGPGVFGGLWLLVWPTFTIGALLGMAAYAALAAAVLLSHQPPQIETDAAAGKRSFAVRHGAATARRVATWLWRVALACLGAALFVGAGTRASAVAFVVVAVVVAGLRSADPTPRRILVRTSLPIAGGLIVGLTALAL